MNLKDRILQIREIGLSTGVYKVYLRPSNLKESSFYINEQELNALDNLYNGEITTKVSRG